MVAAGKDVGETKPTLEAREVDDGCAVAGCPEVRGAVVALVVGTVFLLADSSVSIGAFSAVTIGIINMTAEITPKIIESNRYIMEW